MSNQVPSVFQAFLHQKVEVTESKRTSTIGGQTYTFDNYRIAPTDTTIAALEDLATKNGFVLRIHLPNMAHTADYLTDRLNAGIAKTPAGHWEIAALHIG